VEYSYLFLCKKGACEENTVVASELDLCYHNVKHSLIYNSFNCNTKLSHHVLSDLKSGSKLSCGRTKGDASVTNVLAPLSVTDLSETL
jgi:hypothetical protein